jgi:hypothetical protein
MDLEFPCDDVTDEEIGSIMEQLSQLAGTAGEHLLFHVCMFSLFTFLILKLWCTGCSAKMVWIIEKVVVAYFNTFRISQHKCISVSGEQTV